MTTLYWKKLKSIQTGKDFYPLAYFLFLWKEKICSLWTKTSLDTRSTRPAKDSNGHWTSQMRRFWFRAFPGVMWASHSPQVMLPLLTSMRSAPPAQLRQAPRVIHPHVLPSKGRATWPRKWHHHIHWADWRWHLAAAHKVSAAKYRCTILSAQMYLSCPWENSEDKSI